MTTWLNVGHFLLYLCLAFLASILTDPQKSAPCITAVGYNGVQLWQNGKLTTIDSTFVFWVQFLGQPFVLLNLLFFCLVLLNQWAEGFVSAEVLASTLEKAWLSLHVQVIYIFLLLRWGCSPAIILLKLLAKALSFFFFLIQETTATFLTAALASRQSEQIPSEVPLSVSREIGSSSSATSTNTNASVSVDKKDVDHGKVKNENHAPLVEVSRSRLFNAIWQNGWVGYGVKRDESGWPETLSVHFPKKFISNLCVNNMFLQ